MSLYDQTCGVLIYGPRAEYDCCEHGDFAVIGCDRCRIGCFNPARHRNPFFGREFAFDPERYWWRSMYSYTEWLCAQCYDDMLSSIRESEDAYRVYDPDYEEDPEYTKLLESL